MWSNEELEEIEDWKKSQKSDGLGLEYSSKNDCNGWIAVEQSKNHWQFANIRKRSFYCVDVVAPDNWKSEDTKVEFYPNHIAVIFDDKKYANVFDTKNVRFSFYKISLEDLKEGRELALGKRKTINNGKIEEVYSIVRVDGLKIVEDGLKRECPNTSKTKSREKAK